MAAGTGFTRMIVVLDAASLIPPYEQLRSQIATLIASGALKVADRLPAIRQLAGDLGIASGTVARAYRELEVLGLVHAKKRGTFVTATPKQNATELVQNKEGPFVKAAEVFALAAWQIGVSPEHALTIVREALAKYPVRD